MYKRLLVPVDFSVCSRNAFIHALKVTTHFGGQIDVMTAYDVPAYLSPEAMLVVGQVSASWLDYAEKWAGGALAAFVAETARTLRVDRQIVMPGPAATAILRLADETPYDLIVMGTHGRTGFSRVVLGSVAERVLRAAPCPVLTLRNQSAE
jgi:nucleotide-binding universal stress UspA family protein